jgi:hypothetical protein
MLFKKRNLILVFVVLFSSYQLIAQNKKELNVLFVGNSFTYFYNLSQVVTAMSETKGFKIKTRQSTVGGSNLEQHWKEDKGTQIRKILSSQKWDYVVFNNHSSSPARADL